MVLKNEGWSLGERRLSRRTLMKGAAAGAGAVAAAATVGGGLSPERAQATTTATPAYLKASMPGVDIVPILTVGDMPATNGYRMVGIPDGLGAYDNGNGTFTLLMNHELRATAASSALTALPVPSSRSGSSTKTHSASSRAPTSPALPATFIAGTPPPASMSPARSNSTASAPPTSLSFLPSRAAASAPPTASTWTAMRLMRAAPGPTSLRARPGHVLGAAASRQVRLGERGGLPQQRREDDGLWPGRWRSLHRTGRSRQPQRGLPLHRRQAV